MTAATASPEPDVRAMHAHLAWLVDPARSSASDLRLEIAWGKPDVGPNCTRTYGIRELNDAVGFAAWINRRGCNVYVGATLKSPDAPPSGRLRASMAALATCLPVDVDDEFAAAAAKLADICRPQLLSLTGRTPETRAQMFVRIKPTADFATWEEAHKRLISACGGDENATGRARLMRLGGSVSFPSSKKASRGYVVERTSVHPVSGPEYSVPDLLAALPAPPARAQAVGARATSAGNLRWRPKPPLASIQAALGRLPDSYATERHLWFKVGCALHDFDSGPLGLSLWTQFSGRCPEKATGTDFDGFWEGFGRPREGNCITTSWLVREAVRNSFGG